MAEYPTGDSDERVFWINHPSGPTYRQRLLGRIGLWRQPEVPFTTSALLGNIGEIHDGRLREVLVAQLRRKADDASLTIVPIVRADGTLGDVIELPRGRRSWSQP